MMQGTLIVMEGIDGSGKSTQYRLLTERLTAGGRDFRTVKFPRYDQESSALIRSYLAGDFGGKPEDVNAYAASTFYAVDRFASFRTDWGEYYSVGGLVLCDRWTTSNACHQGSKFPAGPEREHFLDWLAEFEYGLLGLPQPDRVLYLDAGIDLPLENLKRREGKTGETKDIHEKDRAYLAACLEAGRFAAAHYGWTRIDCARDGSMRPAEDIQADIYRAVLDII